MGRGLGWICAIAALGLVLTAQGASACEEYLNHDMAALKEYRDKLIQPDADPFDRMFAFQQLVCSSNPTMRAYAVREGMKSASDPIVRHQILLDAMMQKTRLDIEMTVGTNATKADKEYVRSKSGVLAMQVPYASAQEGCVSLYSKERCLSHRSIFIRGDNVKLTYDNFIGEFYLGDGNELVGFVRVNDRSEHGRIPAVIRLN